MSIENKLLHIPVILIVVNIKITSTKFRLFISKVSKNLTFSEVDTI